jgi:hypothetical protein
VKIVVDNPVSLVRNARARAAFCAMGAELLRFMAGKNLAARDTLGPAIRIFIAAAGQCDDEFRLSLPYFTLDAKSEDHLVHSVVCGALHMVADILSSIDHDMNGKCRVDTTAYQGARKEFSKVFIAGIKRRRKRRKPR